MTAETEAFPLGEKDVLWAAWSPDGEWIAFSTGEARDAPPGWEAANDLFVARVQFLKSPDGEITGVRLRDRQRVLGPSAGGTYGWWGTTYAWAPSTDGNRPSLLAYARPEEVGLVDLSARRPEARPLTRFPPLRTYGPWAWVPSLSWSPDGLFLLAVVHGVSPTGEAPEDSPVFDLYALGVPAAPGGYALEAKLAAEVGMWANPLFSPDGERILFGRARIPYVSQTSTYDLYLMDRDGSDRRLLFPKEEGEPGLTVPAMAWEPEGRRVLVVYQGDLWLVDVEGEARRVTEDGAVTTVCWRGG